MRLQLILLLGLVVISATADERIKRPTHRRPPTHRLTQVRRRPPPPSHVALQAIPYPGRRSKSLAPGKAPKAPVQAAKKPTASAKRPTPPKVAKAAPRQAVLRQSLQQIQQNFAANSARPQGPSIGSIRQQLGIQQVRLPPPRVPTLAASPTNALSNVRSNFNSLRTRLNGAGLRFRQRLPSVGQRFRNAFGTSAAAAAAVPPALRRNSKLPPVFFKKAEDIPGYTKFTLDDVIVDEEDSSEVIEPRNPLNSADGADSILARSDNGDDITLVDTSPKKPQSPPAAKREEAATTNETGAPLEIL